MPNYQANIQEIQSSIQKHASLVQRDPKDIQVVTVTKYEGPEVIDQLYQLGIRHLGENRPGVFLEKVQYFQKYPDIVWHYIGSLQTRPVRKVIDHIDYLHSLDRPSLAKEIQKRAKKPVKCFLQMNISGEASKSGLAPDQVPDFLDLVKDMDKIQIIGLMTMAPIDASQADLHHIFSELRTLAEQIQALKLDNCPCTELSMGMSSDYPVAVQEGATYLRLGSAFFKED